VRVAESIAFIHDNWMKAVLDEKMKQTAVSWNLNDLNIGPVLSHTTKNMLSQMFEIPGAYVAFGGKELQHHTTPEIYGILEPTAV